MICWGCSGIGVQLPMSDEEMLGLKHPKPCLVCDGSGIAHCCEPEVAMPPGCQPWGAGLKRGGWHAD